MQPEEPTTPDAATPTEPTAAAPDAAAPTADAAPAADAAAPAAPLLPEDPAQVLAVARAALAWCRDHPDDDTAPEQLNTVFQLVHDPALYDDVVAAAQAVVTHAAARPNVSPALHAHMTVLMAMLLDLPTHRDPIDALFVAWLRNPDSYGGVHETPSQFQRQSFVQRVGDLLGWGALDTRADRDVLLRFVEWVDSWNPRNKFKARRTLDAIRRNFGPQDVWSLVRFPAGGHHGH